MMAADHATTSGPDSKAPAAAGLGSVRALLLSDVAVAGGCAWVLHCWWLIVTCVSYGGALNDWLAAAALAVLTAAWGYAWLQRLSPFSRAVVIVFPLMLCHAIIVALVARAAAAAAAGVTLTATALLLPVAYAVMTPWLACVMGAGVRGTGALGGCVDAPRLARARCGVCL
jgi:hypothetical protein